ncbi:MAG: glycosyltransferase family 2 protein [Parcubacteria group bacterium]|nr:glycosyltransferase family 2 protein [Parcubacteria group bacterium]
MKLSVIVPAFNESERIIPTLDSLNNYLSKQSYDWEVLVVNDGSTDNTAEVVRSFMFHVSGFRLLDNKENHGKGWVVRQGMLAAEGDFRLFMDADNATRIETVEKFWPLFNQGYDVVIASIGIKGADVAGTEKFYRRIFGKLGNLWIQFWVTPGILDTQRGFKMFSKVAAGKIFPKLKILKWGFDVEVLALARKFTFKIKEVPIKWVNDPKSHVKLTAYIQVLLEVLKIRWNLWTNKYNV